MDKAQTHQRAQPGTTEGDWWRFSMYEIRDGCIRPTEDAKLEWYDPWPEFQGTRKQTIGQGPDGAQPSYQSLSKLWHELEYVPGHKRYPDCLTKKSQDAILAWCQQYGLLGVLLSRWEAINLAPHRSESGIWYQTRYARGFGQVVQRNEAEGDLEDRPANVLIHELNSLEVKDEPPSRTWGRFFPSVEIGELNTFFYPQPYTDEFCHLYGERLIDFCNAAKLLAGARLHLSGKQISIEGEAKLAREQALDTINLLRRPVSSVLDFDKRSGEAPPRSSFAARELRGHVRTGSGLWQANGAVRLLRYALRIQCSSSKILLKDLPVAGAEAASAVPDQGGQGFSRAGPKSSADRRCAPSAPYDSERLA